MKDPITYRSTVNRQQKQGMSGSQQQRLPIQPEIKYHSNLTRPIKEERDDEGITSAQLNGWFLLMGSLILIGIVCGWFVIKNQTMETWISPTMTLEELNQEQYFLPSETNETALIQILRQEDGEEIQWKKLLLVSTTNQVIQEVKPEVSSSNKQYDLLEIRVSHQVEETVLMLQGFQNGEKVVVPLQEIPAKIKKTTPRSAGVMNTDWLKEQAKPRSIQKVYFFGESLILEDPFIKNGMTYELVQEGVVKQSNSYQTKANQGIRLADLEAGHYAISLEGEWITSSTIPTVSWYTIKRNEKVKEIQLSRQSGYLILTVEEHRESPEEVYDLLIDAGHGGMDGGATGNGKIEAEEVLTMSQYLAERFEDHGLKVKLTREDMNDPSQSNEYQYESMPYLTNGRVDQVYRYQPKYVISNHLNALDGSLEGFELYSSIETSDEWTALISNQLEMIGREAKDSLRSEFRVSKGSYKKTFQCSTNEEGCDLIYMIRETGGQATDPMDLRRWSATYRKVPMYGSETILIEHAYIDHSEEMKKWEVSMEEWAEAIIEATVTYLNIPYRRY